MDVSVVQCGDCQVVLWLHTEVDPEATEWAKAISKAAGLLEGWEGQLASLVVTDGGAPSTVQRRQIFTDLLPGDVSSAVVTTVLTNPVKRGIATALLWLNPSFRAYGPEQWTKALAHLQVSGHEAAVLGGLQQLQAKLPDNKTLQLIVGQQA